MANYIPNGRQQFCDANGTPLALGTVGMYVVGTLTPLNTWQDAGQTTLNTNPITLDAGGFATIYGTSQCRQIVKDSLGNVIWDRVVSPLGVGTISVKDYGAAGNLVADDTTAVQSAINAAALLGAEVYLPAGNYKITAGLTASLSSGRSIKIRGDGSSASIITLHNTGSAKTVLGLTLADWTSAFTLRDLGLRTDTANQDSGFVATCTTPASAPAITDPSVIDNVTFMGSDGPVVTNYFANNVILNEVSSVNFARTSFLGYNAGAGAYASNGIGVKVLGTAAPKFGVVYNFIACQFVNVGTGLYYGTYIQGVTIAASNFTGCTTGISIPDKTGTGELTVTGSQFACGSYGINDTGEWGIEVGSCYFNIQQPGASLNNYGIYSANPNGLTVSGSYFARQSTGAGTSYGVYITGTGTIGSAITGNTFDSLDYGQFWNTDTALLTSGSNAYSSCTHLCWDLGTAGTSKNGDAIARLSTAISLGASLAAATTTTVNVTLPTGMFAIKPAKVQVSIGDGTVPLLVWPNYTSTSTSTLVVEVYNPGSSSAPTGPYRFNVQAAP